MICGGINFASVNEINHLHNQATDDSTTQN